MASRETATLVMWTLRPADFVPDAQNPRFHPGCVHDWNELGPRYAGLLDTMHRVLGAGCRPVVGEGCRGCEGCDARASRKSRAVKLYVRRHYQIDSDIAWDLVPGTLIEPDMVAAPNRISFDPRSSKGHALEIRAVLDGASTNASAYKWGVQIWTPTRWLHYGLAGDIDVAFIKLNEPFPVPMLG